MSIYYGRKRESTDAELLQQRLTKIKGMGEDDLAKEVVALLADPPKYPPYESASKKRPTFPGVSDVTDPEQRSEIAAVVGRKLSEFELMDALDDVGKDFFLRRLSRRTVREVYTEKEPAHLAEHYLRYGVKDSALADEVIALEPESMRIATLEIMMEHTFMETLREQMMYENRPVGDEQTMDGGRPVGLRVESLRRMITAPDERTRRLGINLVQGDLAHGKYRPILLGVMHAQPETGSEVSPITPQEEHALLTTIVGRGYRAAYVSALNHVVACPQYLPEHAVELISDVYQQSRREYARDDASGNT